MDRPNIVMPFTGGNIRIVDGNQYDIPVIQKGWKCKQLLLLARGMHSYVYFRMDNPMGEIRYYIEEQDPLTNQLKLIEDEDLFQELASYVDDYHNKIKPEGSTVG
jgi:hypothetical protein